MMKEKSFFVFFLFHIARVRFFFMFGLKSCFYITLQMYTYRRH